MGKHPYGRGNADTRPWSQHGAPTMCQAPGWVLYQSGLYQQCARGVAVTPFCKRGLDSAERRIGPVVWGCYVNWSAGHRILEKPCRNWGAGETEVLGLGPLGSLGILPHLQERS